MTDAESAYAYAEEQIAQAKAGGWTKLDLNMAETRALEKLPPEIAGLTALKQLVLNNTQISDASPLAGLTSLTLLYLTKTQIGDVEPLARLTALEKLHLGSTQVKSVASLAGLLSLKVLRLTGTKIADIANLSGMTGLERLYLRDTLISDVTPLAGLTRLHRLELRGTQVIDLRPIRGLRRLVEEPYKIGRDTDGLNFKNCAAAQQDPRIAEIAGIKDPSERAQTLFDYLEHWQPPEM